MAEYLFLVTIGPVQEFIAGVRRTRDLWFGSWLLSALAREAAEAIQRHGGEVTLIFPPPAALHGSDDGLANVANKILARVTASPEDVGAATHTSVAKRLLTIWQEASKPFASAINASVAKDQIGDLIDVYWTAVGLPSAEEYAHVRREVEALMAARKATRDFAPVSWGDTIPKSSYGDAAQIALGF